MQNKVERTKDITQGHTTGPNALGGADMGYKRKIVAR